MVVVAAYSTAVLVLVVVVVEDILVADLYPYIPVVDILFVDQNIGLPTASMVEVVAEVVDR